VDGTAPKVATGDSGPVGVRHAVPAAGTVVEGATAGRAIGHRRDGEHARGPLESIAG
jgi:hypothetical protein